MTPSLQVPGRAAAALRRDDQRAWRAAVARAGAALGPARAVRLDFALAPRRWVDLDSLVEIAIAGLRDGGMFSARLSDLDGFVATKGEGPPGLTITPADPRDLAAEDQPGPVALDLDTDHPPRPGQRDAKRALRERLGQVWSGRPFLDAAVWTDVALSSAGSLLGPLEPVLDTLEPVLGRDPRGQPRQEFFPNDDRIVWLRVRRADPGGPALRVQLGPLGSAPIRP